MDDNPDFAARAAADLRVIKEAMQQVEDDPTWPARLGEGELHPNPLDLSPVWTIGGKTYSVDSGLIAEVDPEKKRGRIIDPVALTIKEVGFTDPKMN